jgi:hypothetical protein
VFLTDFRRSSEGSELRQTKGVMMRKSIPRRFWIEAVLAGLSGFLFLLTLVWKDWIERILGLDPDHHNGSLEWLVVALLLLGAISFGALARAQWRHALPTKAPDGSQP